MRQSFIFFLPVLLLLLLHEMIIVVYSFEQQKTTFCSSTKSWGCNLKEVMEAPKWVIEASKNIIEQSPEEYSASDFNDLLLHTAYQTPVDDITGKLYVALRLDWHINNEFIQSRNVTFWLQINQYEHDETAISTIFMKIYGYRNEEENAKKNRTLFHIDFQAFIDKKLQIGRTYDLTLFYKTDDGLKTFISSKTLDIPMIHLDAEDNRTIHCDAEHIEKSRKIAARWVSAIYTVEKSISKSAIIKFYAAPKWFCFDSYEIGIFKNDALHKSVIVTSDQLYRDGPNWMGNVTFFDIRPNITYFVTVKPNERRMNDQEICLCRISSSCNCVLSKSKSFEIDDFPYKFGRGLVIDIGRKYIPELPVEKTKEKETKPLIIVFLIFSIIAAILIIVFLVICVYRILKRSTKWQKTLLIKSSGSGESLTPLIKTPSVQKIFILNPNVEKSEFVTELAQFLQSKGLTVFYFAFDSKQLEENAFYYVHKAIADSDKIILFHGSKTQKFIEDGKIIYDRISSNYFENAFIIALSLLKLNDSKILHANFIDDNLNSSKFLITETLYTLPRDLSYLFQGLRLQIDQTSINHLNDSFNIQKNSETNELESIIVCRNDSPEIIRNEEAESVINSIGIIENNNEKTDISDQSNTDSGFHSI